MKVHMVLQPFEDGCSLYDELKRRLADEKLTEFTAVVAWAKQSGLQRIGSLLQSFRARGGKARILLGVDEGGASIEGLRSAIDEFDRALVLFDSASGTFHPKLYQVAGDNTSIVIIGSNNLTKGGLFSNYEAGVCIELDLAREADLQLHNVINQYVRRLEADATSRPLTTELIDQLLADGSFHIGHEAGAKKTIADDDSLGISRRLGKASSLFGQSQHKKKRDPAPVHGAAPTSRKEREQIHDGTLEEGGSTAEVVARWSKQLTRSDSGRPRTGSQTTAALRFTKARHPIDQTRWFRERLFGDEAWQPDPSRAGREIARIRFDVTIGGVPRGTHELPIKHDAVREAGQHNFTTDLKWGSLSPILRSEDLTDKWVTIEKLSDGSLRLTVADTATSGFMA